MTTEARSTDSRGWRVVSRRADDDVERGRLLHEATMLGLARHPGVIEVVRSDPDGEELVTAAPTRSTLAEVRGRPDDALRILAAACETVADLHALGIVHGAISAQTILAEAGRPPVLDGFAQAGLAGEPGVDGEPRRPADDVRALADLARDAWAARSAPRASRSRRTAPRRGELAQLLRHVAEGRTPPARRLARAIAEELGPPTDAPMADPAPTVAPVDHPEPQDPFARLRPVEGAPNRRPPRLVALGAGVIGVASLTWGVLGLGSGQAAPPRVEASPTTTRVVRPLPPAGPPAPAPVRVARDGVLVVGDRHYVVGGRADQAIAAAWGCTGRTHVVLLRPSTGELFVFATWARAGHDVRAVPAGRVPPGSRLSAATDRSGCARARTTAPNGATHVVAIGRP